jgi:hypothetical protein
MGAGRDGGRDLYYRGSLIWKPIEDQPGEVWEGYTVLQAKHMGAPSSKHQENAAWLWGQFRGELDAWADGSGSDDVKATIRSCSECWRRLSCSLIGRQRRLVRPFVIIT